MNRYAVSRVSMIICPIMLDLLLKIEGESVYWNLEERTAWEGRALREYCEMKGSWRRGLPSRSVPVIWLQTGGKLAKKEGNLGFIPCK